MLPRAGQEVLVDFLEGDPEQPVIVGRLFNQTHPVPHRLPEHDTRSAWKSDSSPGSDGFNEIVLEDKKGAEVLYAQAEKDARRLVKHDDTSTIVHDRSKSVGDSEIETTDHDRVQETKHDRVELTYGDRTAAVDGTRRDRVGRDEVERIEGEQQAFVGKDRHVITAHVKREHVERDAHLQIGGGRPEAVGGTYLLLVHEAMNEAVGSYSVEASGPKGWIHLMTARGEIKIESADKVTVNGAGGFVEVGGGKVVIQGSEVLINQPGSAAQKLPGPGSERPSLPRDALVDEPEAPKVPVARLD
jgi:type VI secretion system secreted protein VgrG